MCGAGTSAESFVTWLTALKERVGIPAKLGGKGVTRDHIAKLVEIAVNDTCHQTNPRRCTADDFRRIFAAAMWSSSFGFHAAGASRVRSSRRRF